MVSARDAYDDWYDDEPFAGDEAWPDGPRVGRGAPDAARSSHRLSVVRPAPLAFELVRPADFDCAQRIADRLRDGVPVLIDLEGCDRALAGRLTDFASGLVYAVGGALQQVGNGVILLTPAHLTVSGDEASDVRPPGFYNRI